MPESKSSLWQKLNLLERRLNGDAFNEGTGGIYPTVEERLRLLEKRVDELESGEVPEESEFEKRLRGILRGDPEARKIQQEREMEKPEHDPKRTN